MLDDTIITVRVHGLDAQEVIKRLGGLGRDKPIHAITIGEDLFGKLAQVEEWYQQTNLEGQLRMRDADALQEILDGDGASTDTGEGER